MGDSDTEKANILKDCIRRGDKAGVKEALMEISDANLLDPIETALDFAFQQDSKKDYFEILEMFLLRDDVEINQTRIRYYLRQLTTSVAIAPGHLKLFNTFAGNYRATNETRTRLFGSDRYDSWLPDEEYQLILIKHGVTFQQLKFKYSAMPLKVKNITQILILLSSGTRVGRRSACKVLCRDHWSRLYTFL